CGQCKNSCNFITVVHCSLLLPCVEFQIVYINFNPKSTKIGHGDNKFYGFPRIDARFTQGRTERRTVNSPQGTIFLHSAAFLEACTVVRLPVSTCPATSA